MSPVYLNSQPIDGARDKTLFEYADELSVRVPTSCGRNGKCHECIVEIRKGGDALSQPTEAESFLTKNYRLACQTYVNEIEKVVDFSVLRRQPKILTAGTDVNTNISPAVVRDGNNVIYNNGESSKIIDIYRGSILGLAIDIGTTTVVINLVDLESGEIIHTSSFENPQRFGGSDIMNRISYDGGKYAGELQAVLVSSINFEIGEMVKIKKIRRNQIYEIVAVGNTTMRDIFLGLNVQTIGVKPYKSITEFEMIDDKRPHTAITVTAKSLGLRINRNGMVYTGPLISSHLGSDTSANLLTIDAEHQKDPFLLVDVGTNTEVVFGCSDRYIAASCPAGPAFEGGEITFGMPGYGGAIEHITVDPNSPNTIEVIDNVDPVGICGSGLIDLIAGLRKNNMMNELGVFYDKSSHYQFSEVNNLTISRRDLSALSQAKAANYCGQALVIRESGFKLNEISNLFLAGGFANYIDVHNAIEIGFIAGISPNQVKKIGNASLVGARLMLLSLQSRQKLERFVSTVEHIELETVPDFFDFFVEGCQFKPMEI